MLVALSSGGAARLPTRVIRARSRRAVELKVRAGVRTAATRDAERRNADMMFVIGDRSQSINWTGRDEWNAGDAANRKLVGSNEGCGVASGCFF